MNREEITSENFEKVRKRPGLLMVMYMAEWCKSCTKALPAYDEVVHQYMNSPISFGTVDVDADPQLISSNELMVVPTFILYKEGNKIEKAEGVKTKKELLEMIERHL